MLELMSRNEIKEIIRDVSWAYKKEHGEDIIRDKNINKRVAVKYITDDILKSCIRFVPEAKFKIFYGTGQNGYNVFIQKEKLKKICEALDLDYDSIYDEPEKD